MEQLLIYKASAGSGKTFTLAVEYIKHLIHNPRAYRRILAVTFTNKATAEMKERILSQLYGISTGDPGSNIYLRRVAEDTTYSPQEIRERAAAALKNIIHDYSRFRIETIDAFFQSVMRNLARELELSPNLNVELNNEEILSQAVDAMIEKLTPNAPTLALLIDYIEERIANDKRWNVSDEIKRFGRNIFDEGYIEKGANLRQHLKTPGIIGQYRKELEDKAKEAREQMNEFAEIFEEELSIKGLFPEDLKSGARGIAGYFRKIKEGKLTNDVRNLTVEKCLDEPKEWAAKTSPNYNEILSLAASTLIPLLRETEGVRAINNKTVNSCRLSMQHLNKLQLLASIDEEVRQLNNQNNRFLLSDTNALLHNLIGEDDSSFIFEKIGTSIRNVMIDEFQDTSRMQWNNFKILLLEALAQGAESLIVGDVKQSIYRWRNGDWGILNNLNDTIARFPIEQRTLRTNRRSETNIINFNNTFFTHAVEYLDALHVDELGEPCQPLKAAYRDVAQESPRTQENGYVDISFLEPDEDDDYTNQTLTSLGQQVTRLFAAGVNPNDIAILVRKNKNIPLIADYFDKELHCKIVSDEAFRMDASQAVNTLIDAIRYLSNPTDSIAAAKLAGKASAIGPELRVMPLYELFEELFRILRLEEIENQDAYLFAFFDAVLEYLKKYPADIESFIAYWDKTLCRQTIPGGQIEGIRIFSIHKSKGLEFHTVLIPFCDWKLENETTNQLLWCSPEEAPYNQIDIVPVTYSSLMAESVYRQDYLDERLQLWVDNLNLLYVAFTRAGKNLIVWSRKKQKRTVAELLFNALTRIATQEGREWNEDQPFQQGTLCPSEAPNEATTTNKLLQKPEKRTVKMRSMTYDVKFRQSNRSADFIRHATGEAAYRRLIDRGSLLHTFFSAIGTEADIEPAIRQLIFEGIIGDHETEQDIRTVATKAFAHPQIKDWYSGRWRLFNECTIIYKEDGKTQVRRPDRVMTDGQRTIVVDFKFGKPDKRYEHQIRQYMNLLTQMGYPDVEGYLYYANEEAYRLELIT